MPEIKEYDCPNCGGPLKFTPAINGWKCDYCLSEFEKEAIDKIYGTTQEEDLDEQQEELDAYYCDSCGAELIADETTSATFCLYCKSPTIIKRRFSGAFKPKYVIPFSIEKEKSKEIYKTFIRKKLFAPTAFKQDEEIDKLTGIYAPFWLFDCEAHGHTLGEGKKISTWRAGDYEYTKTKFYRVERTGYSQYEKIPVDASTKLDDQFMNMIEPYRYEEIKEFTMHYLTGFMAEKYDVEMKDSEKVMEKRAEEFISSRLRETIHGYSSYTPQGGDVHLHDVANSYALMPIYLLVNKYKDKEHIFIVNGQTGKIVGDTPIDRRRQIVFFILLSVLIWILTVFGGAFFV